jgi:hypothetical protein
MALFGAALLVVGFLLLFKLFGLLEKARQALALSRLAYADLSNSALDDLAKEQALQAHAIGLSKAFVILTAGGAACLLLPYLLLVALDRLNIVSLDAAMAMALSWEFILGAAFATVAVLWLLARNNRDASTAAPAFENRYSASNQMLHRLAFSSRPAQIAIADWEDRLYCKELQATAAGDPVFIMALPRAGTTLLLELCANLDEFVTHTYRNMPFVLNPLLWQRYSRAFQTQDEARERAHGDGMQVSADSPEAFEEMLWMAFWKDHYRLDCIEPWTERDVNPEFVDFFQRHMQKIALLQNDAAPAPRRYVSKNNLNIARASWIARTWPRAKLLILFRDPLQQAQSLLRQHKNFLDIHGRDSFAREYMAGIGHFDFGANLRPVDFADWLGSAETEPTTLSFWLRYWTAAYRDLAREASERIRFVDYDRFSKAPGPALEQIADYLAIRDRAAFVQQQERVQVNTRGNQSDQSAVDSALYQDAMSIHAQLRALSLF